MANQPQNNRRNQSNSNRNRGGNNPLPHPEILEGYDYVIEGSAERILAMFEAEQKHRHDWESRALRVHGISSLTGQILGFFIAVSVFASAIVIGLYGDTNTAAFIWVFGLAIIVMAGLVWTYAKSMGQRPLFARPAMRQNFRAEKKGDA